MLQWGTKWDTIFFETIKSVRPAIKTDVSHNFKVLFYTPSVKIILCPLKCVPTSVEPQKEHLPTITKPEPWVCKCQSLPHRVPSRYRSSSSPGQPCISSNQGFPCMSRLRNHPPVSSRFHLTALNNPAVQSSLYLVPEVQLLHVHVAAPPAPQVTAGTIG